jgi:hypothetical protein
VTKFCATVCLPPTAPREIPAALAGVLAPYDHNLTDDWNPVGQWDRWVIDGTAGHAFLTLPAHDGDRRLITASTVPRRKAALDPLGPLECYGGPRGLLDFDAMRRRAMAGHDALLAARSVPGWALVTLNGEWTDADADADGYWERANSYLDGLDAEAVVVDLLCHC